MYRAMKIENLNRSRQGFWYGQSRYTLKKSTDGGNSLVNGK